MLNVGDACLLLSSGVTRSNMSFHEIMAVTFRIKPNVVFYPNTCFSSEKNWCLSVFAGGGTTPGLAGHVQAYPSWFYRIHVNGIPRTRYYGSVI